MKQPHSKPIPIRCDKPKSGSIWRIPLDGYVTPRLSNQKTDAIGFIHKFDREDEE